LNLTALGQFSGVWTFPRMFDFYCFYSPLWRFVEDLIAVFEARIGRPQIGKLITE
jgi:hypothetical protein